MTDYLTATVKAVRDDAGPGGFTAVASAPSVDRDGERVAYRAFEPLPASLPLHIDHTFSIEGLVGRAVPRYADGKLYIDARFASTSRSQAIRTLVREGIIDSVSVGFMGSTRRKVDGVQTVVKAELLEVSLVTVPSNRDALVVSARHYGGDTRAADTHALVARALADLAAVQLHDAQVALDGLELADAGAALAEARSLLADMAAPSGHTLSLGRPVHRDRGRQWPPPYWMPGSV